MDSGPGKDPKPHPKQTGFQHTDPATFAAHIIRMYISRTLLPSLFLLATLHVAGQAPRSDVNALIRAELTKNGFLEEDLRDMILMDDYATTHNGMRHIYLRQRWMGIVL